jgi:5-methylcytosine-specific restriction endonuclease McrA
MCEYAHDFIYLNQVLVYTRTMKTQKCTNCKRIKPETGANFAIRTRNIFKILPFFCKDCTRVSNALNPTSKILKKQQRTDFKRERKTILKTSIKHFSCDKNVLKAKEENKIIARKKGRIHGNISRAKRAHAYIDLEQEEKLAIRKFYDECPPGNHVDHIIPISKGGKHILANLQYLLASENSSKNNKVCREVLEKYLEIGKLSVSYLQRKYKMSYEAAEKLIIELNI